MELQTEPTLNQQQPMTDAEMETYRLHRKFDRMGRLVGDDAMKKLMQSHVMVLGLGGVGSWAAEALVRSGVGKLTIVDFDEVCVTNFNRQLHAVGPVVGQPKTKIMEERLLKINPAVKIVSIEKFYNQARHEEIFSERPDFVLDAIDHVTSKCYLLARCRSEGIPIVTSTGSGGRMDPTQIRAADLSDTIRDPLAKDIRRVLRQEHNFPGEGQGGFGITAIYSEELPTKPMELHYDNGKGFRCVCPQGDNEFFNCDSRNMIYGNAGFVTGTFGFVAASQVVKAIVSK